MTKFLKLTALVLFAIALPIWMSTVVEGQSVTEALTTDMDAKTRVATTRHLSGISSCY